MNFTTEECMALLPKVLLDYIWKLVAERNVAKQIFVLTRKQTGCGDFQDILIRRNQYSSWRSVFGYEPLNVTIEVTRQGKDYAMALQNA